MSSTLPIPVDITLTDVEYVVSDLHLNHQNIIEYCRNDKFDATRSGLDDMNWHLLAEWNRHVGSDETVVFVGDFAWFIDQDPITQRKVDNLWDTLAGEKVFVRGDHDHVVPTSAETVVYSAEIQREDRTYFVSHFPGDTPESLPGKGMPDDFEQVLPDAFADRLECWRIHGHHHNNWPDLYPLVNPDRQTVNCSVELTDYRPLSMDMIDEFVAHNEWKQSL